MKVLSIEAGSAGELAGILSGDDLVEIAGRPIRDAIDVAYVTGWEADKDELLFVFVRDGDRMAVSLPALHPADSGIELAPDRVRTCSNRCIFCFVDQLPAGLRPSLYIKDEDYRLSFTDGSYVTLANLPAGDHDRIVEQKLSPLYVSVHATDDRVRRRLLGNPDAAPIMEELARLIEGGISLNAQIVICPGINDGSAFERTLDDLLSLGARMESIAVVPVGLTRHRQGLPHLEPVTQGTARELVAIIRSRQKDFQDATGSPRVYAADELYLLAGIELPPYEHYGEFPQLENGVGLLRFFERTLSHRIVELERIVSEPMALTIVTAELAAPFLQEVIGRALASVAPIETRVIAVENRFLGRSVTVAGLLSGEDMTRALRKERPEGLTLLPGEAFNADGLTIDGMTLREIAAATGLNQLVRAHDIVDAIADCVQSSQREANI
jgi:putative radical SAM enzyme (TIGR03279 family)